MMMAASTSIIEHPDSSPSRSTLLIQFAVNLGGDVSLIFLDPIFHHAFTSTIGTSVPEL
jgi:hypothetical protein